MDEFDVFPTKPSTTQENDLVEFGNTKESINNQDDDFSWVIENHPNTTLSFQSDDILNNITVSQPPTTENIHSTNQQSEVKSSFNMFSNEELSPLEAILKKREQEIAAKDAEEKRKIEELRKQAKNDLERWYNERQKQIEQKKQTIKNEEDNLRTKAFEKSTKESCDWTKVIRLLEFTDGAQLSKSKRDLTRMKTCIFNAKRVNDKKKLENGP